MLSVSGLEIELSTAKGPALPVRGLHFSLEAGESVCLVGESGCGKSLTALSLLRLLPDPPLRIKEGTIRFRGRDLRALPFEEMRRLRGRELAMIFQEPMTALNPVLTVRDQIAEAITTHLSLGASEVRRRVIDLLGLVGIPEPEKRCRAYPHQLSGGLRQRAMIAMALACGPELLIADEPTTALDVTIQAQILDLLAQLRSDRSLALLLITHNLGVVAQIAHRVMIMYTGQIVEEAPVRDLFIEPLHPYTQGLLASVPYNLPPKARRLASIPGNVPPLGTLPVGCPFQDRCPRVMPICRKEDPQERAPAIGRRVRCHLW